jgi:hypothetical protein
MESRGNMATSESSDVAFRTVKALYVGGCAHWQCRRVIVPMGEAPPVTIEALIPDNARWLLEPLDANVKTETYVRTLMVAPTARDGSKVCIYRQEFMSIQDAVAFLYDYLMLRFVQDSGFSCDEQPDA